MTIQQPAPTRAEILAADPQQLRLWVAEFLFGYSWHPGVDGLIYFRRDENFIYGAVQFNETVKIYELPDYPNDIGAAWTVVEEMERRDFHFKFHNIIPGSDPIVYEVMFNDVYDNDFCAPFAICRAALLARCAE